MLFHEIYSNYYNLVADIIKAALNDELTKEYIYDLVSKKGFGESSLNISVDLLKDKWHLITDEFDTPLLNEPKMPLTTLQKRWLKSILLDPRIKLFSPDITGLENIEPLYKNDTFVYFDRYSDGDDFKNPIYIKNFQTILKALKYNKKLSIKYKSTKNNCKSIVCIPSKIEYSSKDDKFRLITKANVTVNIGRMLDCSIIENSLVKNNSLVKRRRKKKELIFELIDERNALERVMLNFSHLEKQTEKIKDNVYKVKLIYDADDETEILIRILSFGPKIKVISPELFINLIKERILKNESCEQK